MPKVKAFMYFRSKHVVSFL